MYMYLVFYIALVHSQEVGSKFVTAMLNYKIVKLCMHFHLILNIACLHTGIQTGSVG